MQVSIILLFFVRTGFQPRSRLDPWSLIAEVNPRGNGLLLLIWCFTWNGNVRGESACRAFGLDLIKATSKNCFFLVKKSLLAYMIPCSY